MTCVKIVATGAYVPENTVDSEIFDDRFGFEKGTSFKKTGVKSRHYSENETQVEMAVKAVKNALKYTDNKNVDCIVFSGGTPERLIPCTASLIQKTLGKDYSSIPCFDVNSTCLGFVTALDTVSYLVDAGKYKRVLIVSSDRASVGLNYENFNASVLFGDAAACVIIEKTPENESSKILTYNFKTFGEGALYARISGGANYLPAYKYCEENKEEYLFHMEGLKLYETASREIENIYFGALKSQNLTIDDIKLVIPHQASLAAMNLIRRKLKIPREKYLYNIENYGNTVSSSIPFCLDFAIKTGRIEKGDKVILLGTSAGLSIGVMILEY